MKLAPTSSMMATTLLKMPAAVATPKSIIWVPYSSTKMSIVREYAAVRPLPSSYWISKPASIRWPMFMIKRMTNVLLMPGSVTCSMRWKRPAPSMEAAS